MPAQIEALIAALEDPAFAELMINADGSVYVERAGASLEALPFKVAEADALVLLKALVGDPGTFGPQRPYADLSAADGSRVHVIAPPVARGLCVTVRKRPSRRPTLQELAAGPTISPAAAAFLNYAVDQRKNILIVGGTSSGKTTLLSALAALVDARERLLVLEDTPELSLPQPHALYLRTRVRDSGGLPDVTLSDLLVNTLRMRPDRILVGEVRGPEAFELLQAMNVGQEGVMSTLHASSSREALQRLETLVLMSGIELPLRVARANIALAVDLIVFMARLADGSRRVVQVTEVTGIELDNITLADLFKLDSRKGGGGGGGGAGFALRPTGAMPRFYDQLRAQGFEPPVAFFAPA